MTNVVHCLISQWKPDTHSILRGFVSDYLDSRQNEDIGKFYMTRSDYANRWWEQFYVYLHLCWFS